MVLFPVNGYPAERQCRLATLALILSPTTRTLKTDSICEKQLKGMVDKGGKWLHSDMKDMAYFYVFKFFEKVNETGGLE